MLNLLYRLSKAIDTLNQKIGESISWLSLLMALVTFLIVVLRYVFNMGWIWLQESVVYMHGMSFMIAGGYTLLHQGHVRVDVIYRPLRRALQCWVDIFGVCFLLWPTCAAIWIYGFPYVQRSWEILETSTEAAGIPAAYLLKSCIILFPLLLALQGLSQLIQSILVLCHHPSQSSSSAS